ncbi:MAG: acyltransferase [Bacteroidetes bacterium]|nr:acyltransferase [Bacteroidota bacterium]
MLRRFLNTYISRVKGESYVIDDNIPGSVLLGIVWTRLMMKLRGWLVFPGRSHKPFIGRRVKLRVKSKIRMGRGVSIGNGCSIDALSQDGIDLGDNVSVGAGTKIDCTGVLRYLGKGLKAEENVGLGTDNYYGCGGGIFIGRDTIVGNFVSFHAENHQFAADDKPIRLQGITRAGIRVGRNCWIGAKATILDDVVIEDGCIIAAGSVVKSGVYTKNGIYGGVPAKFIKSRLA